MDDIAEHRSSFVVLLLTFANFHISYHVDSLLIGTVGFNQQIYHVMKNKNLNKSILN